MRKTLKVSRPRFPVVLRYLMLSLMAVVFCWGMLSPAPSRAFAADQSDWPQEMWIEDLDGNRIEDGSSIDASVLQQGFYICCKSPGGIMGGTMFAHGGSVYNEAGDEISWSDFSENESYYDEDGAHVTKARYWLTEAIVPGETYTFSYSLWNGDNSISYRASLKVTVLGGEGEGDAGDGTGDTGGLLDDVGQEGAQDTSDPDSELGPGLSDDVDDQGAPAADPGQNDGSDPDSDPDSDVVYGGDDDSAEGSFSAAPAGGGDGAGGAGGGDGTGASGASGGAGQDGVGDAGGAEGSSNEAASAEGGAAARAASSSPSGESSRNRSTIGASGESSGRDLDIAAEPSRASIEYAPLGDVVSRAVLEEYLGHGDDLYELAVGASLAPEESSASGSSVTSGSGEPGSSVSSGSGEPDSAPAPSSSGSGAGSPSLPSASAEEASDDPGDEGLAAPGDVYAIAVPEEPDFAVTGLSYVWVIALALVAAAAVLGVLRRPVAARLGRARRSRLSGAPAALWSRPGSEERRPAGAAAGQGVTP